jgi:regulation of enolase protein 1 (concanavalin A-like superfamily)
LTIRHALPLGAESTAPGTATITASPRTDIFVDPQTGEVTATALGALALAPEGDFQLSAKITVGFVSTFDAGCLLVWHDERHSATLCFERSELAVPTVVSVITRGVSDDANGRLVTGNEIWLRISRIGVLAQSPLGEGCTVQFDQLTVTGRTLSDIRDGA